MSSSWESQLTPQESKLFFHLFQTVGKSQPGIVTGQEAVMFFATSGVPNPMLSEIWEEADRDKLGYLTPETFSIALKLIACAQHGKEAVDPILATSVPLPQFDGVAASPAIVHAPSPASTPITPAEREKYATIFKVHQTNGTIDADSAKTVFLKSKLPMETLSQIWFLADVRQSGALNQAEFTIAMHYIAKLMDGTLSALPDKLPPAVYQSANASLPMSSPAIQNTPLSAASPALQKMVMTPPQRARTIDSLGNLAFGSSVPESNWDVTAQEMAQFNAYFDKIDSAKTGVIQGKEAVEFFKNSRLPENDLAQIWDLADMQHRGYLSRNEFAVAMHLIHKKLRGEALPTSLPASLRPPQSSFSPQLPVQASPVVQSLVRSPQPPQSHNLMDDNNDLLGDFGNDQVSNETNQVNLLQNQIQSLSMSSAEISTQKLSSEQALERLLEQKKELEAQFTQVRMAHEQEVKDLNEIQEQLRREEADWNAIRTEFEAAQEQLSDLQNQVAQMNQTLANGRAETESLTRRINEIQEETKQANDELDNMRNKTKQQNMMLDINRRQVTAAEQDRSLAKRNLEDYKATAAMNNNDDDDIESDDDNEEEDKEKEKDKSDSDDFADAVGATSVQDNTAVSTPALDNLFASPSAFGNPVTSPFAETESQTNSNTFDDIFGSAISTTTPTSPENAPASATASDFDAIFGNMASPANSTPSAAFDPAQWSSPTNSATKTFRSPPPPPPQSRHHRQPSESVNSASSSVIGKKQRAPPPPPSAHIETNDDDFDSAFSGQLSEAKIVENTPKEETKQDNKDSIKDDDFEAAFSGDLSQVKIVQSTAKEDDFDEFDDAFSNFDGKPAETKQDDKKAEESKKDWSGFDSFGFGESSAPENKPSSDDWDSIFGTANTSAAKPAASGFDDAFSSFDDNFDAKPSIGLVGDKVEDLVKMGFSEKEAKDALNRYDQDLSKASNYLLDQASKN